jgi:hexosaminidase
VTFTVRNDEEAYAAEICIPDGLAVSGSFEFLAFSVVVPFEEDSLIGATLIERQGDWYLLRLAAPYDGALKVSVSFSGNGHIKKYSGYPYGVYLQNQDARVDLNVARQLNYDIEPERPITLVKPHFIPVPDCIYSQDTLSAPSEIIVMGGAWNLDWLSRLMNQTKLAYAAKGAAWCLTAHEDTKLDSAFHLKIDPAGVSLRYQDSEGFQAGQAFTFQYLLQLLETGTLIGCEIWGEPRYPYRGVHLDVVRHFFEMKDLERWTDWFALFQFNHFHWHLTDDDGWRLESNAYPELTQVGAWRGPEEVLPPQMGTGSERYGGFYTLEEAKQFVARLRQIGMTVVPEMDLPGHARALLKSLPQLQEATDQSEYRSVQFHNDNVINPAFGPTLEIIGTLIEEWLTVFDGPLFHIGCDEVPHGVWQQSPAAASWCKEQQVAIEAVNGLFTQTVEQQLTSANKTLAGWEEVAPTGVSTATWVYSWQGVEAGQKAALAGHPVVMTPAQYCYFDLSTNDKPEDPGYWWAGTLDMERVFHYQPEEGFAAEAAKNIQGIQYCLWSELTDTPGKAEFMWFPRLLAGAQVVWKNDTNVAYPVFLESVDVWTQILLKAGIAVRSRKNGW